jgi:hypothetical protein
VQNAVSPQYIGVATSSSQFFRQIGSVLGIAVFGAVLANVYAGEFDERFNEADRQTVGAEILVQLEDPTLRLNANKYAALQQSVRSLPGGDGSALLDRATDAQTSSIAVATQWIFTGSLIASILSLGFALALKELPLRRAGPIQASAQPPQAAAAGDPLPPGQPTQQPGPSQSAGGS